MKNRADTDRAKGFPGALFARLRSESRVLMLARLALAFSWVYQGAVPKLICMSEGELVLLGHVIPVYRYACLAAGWMGVGEILFGLFLLLAARPWAFRLNIAALLLLLFFVGLFEPGMLLEPFNPFTLNAALIALSAIAIHELKNRKRHQ